MAFWTGKSDVHGAMHGAMHGVVNLDYLLFCRDYSIPAGMEIVVARFSGPSFAACVIQ